MKGEEIRRAREAKGWSQADLARAIGVSQPAIQKIERGDVIKSKYLPDIAKSLGLDAGRKLLVPLVGYVGASSVACFFDEGQGPFDLVEAPESATDMTVAVEVRGDSLGSVFNGWRVFYDNVRAPLTDDMIGRLCVVCCDKGRVMVKEVRRGQLPDHYNLHSNTEPPLYDVRLIWGARVTAMMPAG